MRLSTISGFVALLALTLIGSGLFAIIGHQRESAGSASIDLADNEIAGYILAGTIGGPRLPTTPIDVAVGETGRIFVADISLNRVLAFTADGILDTNWGDAGMSKQFVFPASLAIGPDGSLYVLQLGNAEVHILDTNGNERSFWPAGGNQALTGASVPTAITVDRKGIVYVPDQGSQQVRRYTSSGDELEPWSISAGVDTGGEILPRDIVEWGDRILLSYQNEGGDGGGLIGFDLEGRSAPPPQNLTAPPDDGALTPGSIAISPTGEIAVLYLSDRDDGTQFPYVSLTGSGWAPEGIDTMMPVNGLVVPGIARDAQGRLLIADPGQQRVRMYTSEGDLAGDIQASRDERLLAGLDEIVAGPDGLLYAADPLLGRVVAYQPDGEIAAVYHLPVDPDTPYSTGFTRQRMRIAVDESSSVYVVDEISGQITKIDRDGEIVTTDWAESSNSEQPTIATMLAASADRLYLVDFETQEQIQRFDEGGAYLGLLIEPFWEGSIQDIVIANETIYTVDLGAGASIVRHYSLDGDYLGELANLTEGGGNSNRTGFAIAADPRGGIVIAAVNVRSGPEFEYQLLRLDSSGSLTRIGMLSVPFTTLPDITISSAGALYLAAPNEQTIYVYEPTP